jgi:eukaryotic-like serine/threonine-protein kinase
MGSVLRLAYLDAYLHAYSPDDGIMVGARLGNWVIETEVGQNDLGRLFRARSADGSGRLGALRRLEHPKAKAPEIEKLFLAQVELLRKLRHPSIVAVLDGNSHEGSLYYVMEWVDGRDFQSLLRQGEKIAWAEVLSIALQIVPALRHAHRRSVLHRDLRPANLFRCADGAVKLAEFGIVKFFGDALNARTDNPLGPTAYLSPEQAAGKPHSKRSDFYALGCLLYTLIAGRPPFTGTTLVELSHKHCYVLPERPLHFVPDLPEEFDRLIMKLLAKEPAQRPASGTMLIQELEGVWSLLERRGLLGKRPMLPAVAADDPEAPDDALPPPILPEPIPREPLPWHRRWYVLAPLFAACVLLLLWAFFWRGPSAEELMSQARPLLESDRPDDWEKAWKEYLEPLSRKFPGQYQDEIAETRRRLERQAELNRAFAVGRAAHAASPAERFYRESLRLIQAGEFAAARRVLENLVLVYYTIEEEGRWVALARDAIARLDAHVQASPPPPGGGRLDEAVLRTVDEVKRLRMAGKVQEADSLAQALEFLYRDDPALETLRQLLAEVKK